MTKKLRIFCGGTCNNSTWRDDLIPRLDPDTTECYNPVVPNWTEADYQQELVERATCDMCLYVITPRMTGVYSIAEVIDDSNKRPDKTVFHFMTSDDKEKFSAGQLKSLDKVGQMVKDNGGRFCQTMDELVGYINAAASI